MKRNHRFLIRIVAAFSVWTLMGSVWVKQAPTAIASEVQRLATYYSAENPGPTSVSSKAADVRPGVAGAAASAASFIPMPSVLRLKQSERKLLIGYRVEDRTRPLWLLKRSLLI